MRYRLLGPLEVRHHGTEVPLGGVRRRAVLGMLLLHRNETVSTDTLIDAVYAGVPPRTARQSVHNSIAALRRVLASARSVLSTDPANGASSPPGPLLTQRHGYQLLVSPNEIDVDRFRRLIVLARNAWQDDDAMRASRLLADALDLWCGPPLADLAAAGISWAHCPDLVEEHVSALQLRITADLALGRHDQLVGELEGLVERYPFREQFVAHLMVALHRSGRQAAALERFRTVRTRMIDEMGVEPGSELQAAQRVVLADMAPPSPVASSASTQVQRRLLTVLLVAVDGWEQLPGSTDPEEVAAVLSTRTELVRGIVTRLGGSVVHPFGTTALVVFGWPRARTDDPERAVRAALAMCGTTSSRHPVRVAVATGAAMIASTTSQSAAVVSGHAVTTAAALLEAAVAGQVLTTTTTASATRRAVAYRRAVLDRHAGRDPPPAFEALHLTSAVGHDVTATSVGRDVELQTLLDRAGDVQTSRRPHLVTVIGEAGVGKSRLATELVRRVRDQHDSLLWCVGRVQRFGESTTYGALADVVKRHAGILDDHSDAAAIRKLSAMVAVSGIAAADRPWVVRHLGVLVGAEGDPLDAGPHGDETINAWCRLLAALAATRPVVLVLEDLQWADDALLDLVFEAPERLGAVGVLVVALARPELTERRPAWTLPRPSTTCLALGPLTRAATGNLVRDLLDQHGLTGERTRDLVEHVGGNPLFAEEYVRMLVDLVDIPGDRRALPPPVSVHTIVSARLDGLPLDERAVIADAAVVGRVVWTGAIAAIGGHRDEGRLSRCLERLARRQLLRRQTPSRVTGQTEYVFTHGVVRDVAYERISRRGRIARHLRAAAWLEALSPSRTRDRAELLAHHRCQALAAADAVGHADDELVTRACNAMRAAGDRAMELGAYVGAARWYADALARQSDAPDRADLLFGLAAAHFYQHGGGETDLRQARDALLAAGAASRAAEAEVLLGIVAWRRGGDDRRALARARRLVAAEDMSPSKAFVLSRCALRFAIDGDVAGALKVGNDALVIANRLGLHEHASKAHMAIGMARIASGDHAGLRDLESAVATLEGEKLPLAANALINLATMRAALGDLAGCFLAQQRAREIAGRFGSAAELRWLEAEHVLERYWRGHSDEAAALARRFVDTSSNGSRHYLEPSCQVVHARIHLHRGYVERALAQSANAVARARDADDVQVLAPALALRARACAAADDRMAAEAAVVEVLSVLAGRLLPPEIGSDLAIALVATGGTITDLDDASIAASPWLAATHAYVAGDQAAAAAIYGRVGSVPDARAVVTGSDSGSGSRQT